VAEHIFLLTITNPVPKKFQLKRLMVLIGLGGTLYPFPPTMAVANWGYPDIPGYPVTCCGNSYYCWRGLLNK
jgi:hypothetical protein